MSAAIDLLKVILTHIHPVLFRYKEGTVVYVILCAGSPQSVSFKKALKLKVTTVIRIAGTDCRFSINTASYHLKEL